jgi:uncharacterized membrane protein (DUF485 family)
MIGRYLFAFWKDKFITIIVEHQYLSFPYLINFSGDYLADPVLVFNVDIILLKVKDPGGQVLSE